VKSLKNIKLIQKEVKMIGDKRGLSTIVITLIIILLSLVAVGIVWVVVKNIIVGGGAGIEINSKCLATEVIASSVNCSNGVTNKFCTISFTREGTGSDPIDGVKLVFKNSTSGVSSGLISIAGDVAPLVGKRVIGQDTGLTIANGVNSLDLSVYFKDSAGADQLCSQVKTATF
jgi:hypothetical protein